MVRVKKRSGAGRTTPEAAGGGSDAHDDAIHIVYYLNRPLFCGCQSNGTYFNRQRAVTNNNEFEVTQGSQRWTGNLEYFALYPFS